jgi:hypothetical protein
MIAQIQWPNELKSEAIQQALEGITSGKRKIVF